MLPFVVKYRPKTLAEILGHGTTVDLVKQWIEKWKAGSPQKPLFLYGKAGMGKTSLVQSLANDYDLDILEMNASDKRSSAAVDKIAGQASMSASFSGKMRLLLFDEVDGLYLQDRGGSGSINKILKESKHPVILTANDAWLPKLATIRKHTQLVEVRKVHVATITKLLMKIAEEEGITVDKETAKELAKNAQGDLRSAINDFEFVASTTEKKIEMKDVGILSKRDRTEKSMFTVTQKILKTMDFKEATEAVYNLSERPDFVMQWIAENIPKEYKKSKDLHEAYNHISKADIYFGRVFRRQNYGFWRYANVLMTAGVALSKDERYHGFNRYSFPSGISYLGRSKGDRATQKKVAQKIGKFCHVSRKCAVADYLPMFYEVMKNDETAVSFAYKMDFDEKDLTYLQVQFPKRILKEVDELKKENIKKQISQDKNQHSLSQFF